VEVQLQFKEINFWVFVSSYSCPYGLHTSLIWVFLSKLRTA